ncbi:MAG: molybdate ABC transporter ATP-binding protein ModF [Steroidobacteraceae bacterium]
MTERLRITLHGASVQRGDKWVLRDVSLDLHPGERWALLGGNGAGKTQLLKLLAADVWPTPERAHPPAEARTYRLGANRVDTIEAKPRIAYVGAELQDKYARYGWDLPVHDLLLTGLHRTDLVLQPATAAQCGQVDRMLHLCGLWRLRARRLLSLSYGQKRLALLARSLIQEPDWLLLDELYNGLDATYRRRTDALLDRARRNGQSWVASAHRAADIPRGTQRLAELRAGTMIARRRLARADLRGLTARANERRSAPRPVTVGATARFGVEDTVPLIDVTGADLFVDYRRVLRGVNWQLRRGEHWAIFGANGAGKSSFLKMLYGDLSPAFGGRIERCGCPTGTPIEQWKRRIGYVSSELQTDYRVSVPLVDLVASGRYASIGLHAAPTAADKRAARRWLEFFALTALSGRTPRELSYGELRRALIARALVAAPLALLLDEPLTGLDPQQRATMKDLLERLMRRHITVVMAVHHPEDLPRGIDRALYLHRRRARAVALRRGAAS